MEPPYRFRIMPEYNYTYDTPVMWQAWHEAYFGRVSGVLGANGEWIRLKDNGCTMPEYERPNCTRTCGNATSMFYSEANVWNCIALATVSMEVIQGNKSFVESNVVSIDKTFDLGGSDFQAIDKLGIFRHVRECFSQSCTDSKFGKCTPEIEPYQSRPINAGNILDFASIINGPYCTNGSLGVDSDIAGPGILVSYMMQFALVFLMTTLFWLSGLHRPRTKNEITESSDSSPDPIWKIRKRVKSLIVNLQEAQGSFVFTVSLVYLIAFEGNALGLSNIGTLLSFTINRSIGYGLMIIGTYSVAFFHYFARKSGMHWLERRFLALANLAMLARAHNSYTEYSWAKPERFLDSLRKNAALDKCGNNPGPMSFCLGPRLQGLAETQQTFVRTKKMVYAVYILCVLLLAEDFVRFVRCINKEFDNRLARWLGSPIYPWLLVAFHVLQAVPLAFGLADVVDSFRQIKELNGGEYSWGFGQFVAVSVWGPLALKLIGAFLSMFGAWVWPSVKANIMANSAVPQHAKDFIKSQSSQERTSGDIEEQTRRRLLSSPGISMIGLDGADGSNSANEASPGSELPPTQAAIDI